MKFWNRITIACSALALLTFAVIPAKSVYAASGTDIAGGAAGIGHEVQIMIENNSPLKNLPAKEPEETNEITFNIEPTKEKSHTGTILNGIYAEDINLSGMTYEQALDSINGYISGISNANITLNGIGGANVTVPISDLGISWDDNGILEDAFTQGLSGNIIQRYKARKDLEHEKKVYPIEVRYDRNAIRNIITQMADEQNIPAEDCTLKKTSSGFEIEDGNNGTEIDVNESIDLVVNELTDFKGGDKSIDLAIIESTPKGSRESLEKVHDLLGTFTTSFSSSGSDRSGNVRNGARLINGTVLYPGDQFSTYGAVSPFSEENGYYMAGSYLNGMVVESLGGGICQVSSTLYNAVLRAELQVDERYNHSMIVTYVKMSSDAAISGTSKDFKFTNNSEYPIYIEGYTTEDKTITFNVYGVETRPANRTLEFESVELSKTEPVEEKIVADPGAPVGSISVQGAHTGYTGEFWKIVKVDGVETERVLINKSHYAATPKTATVGTASSNPGASAAIQSAIGSGSIDYVKGVIAELNAAAAAAAAAAPPVTEPAPEAPAGE